METSDQLLQDILRELQKAAENGITFGPKISDYLDKFNKGLLKSAKDLGAINKSIDEYSRQLKKKTRSAKDFDYAINNLKDSLEDLDNSYEKSMAAEKLRNLEAQRDRKASIEDFVKKSADFGKSIIGQTATVGTAVKNITSGASGFQIAGEVLTAGIDLTTSGIKTFGSGIAAAGSGIAFMGAQGRAVGAALIGLGVGLQVIGESVGKFAKFAMPILIAEADKMQKSFEEASAAGALYAGGMKELRETALESNLTQEQFTNIIKNNSELMAQSGVTVASMTKRFGEVNKVLAYGGENSIQSNLLRLGIGFEEQVALQAQVMADQAKFGIAFNRSNIALNTEAYAKNLKVIADITGEDAKRKMDEVRKESERYAFRAKIAEIAEKSGIPADVLMREVNEKLAMMSPLARRAFMQMTVLGTTTETAAYMMPGLVDSLGQSARAFSEYGDTSMKDYLTFAEANKGTYNETLKAISTANIATGAYSDITQLTNEESLNQIKFNRSNYEKAVQDVKAAAEARGELNSEFVLIAQRAQEMRVEMQKIITDNLLPNFAKAVAYALNVMQWALKQFADEAPEIDGKKFSVPKLGFDVKDTAPGEGSVDDGTPPPKIVIEGNGTYKASGVPAEDVLGDGGITKGVSIAGEKGPEAVVPLPNGRSIPVDLDLGPLVVALQDLLDVNKDNRDLLEKLFHASV